MSPNGRDETPVRRYAGTLGTHTARREEGEIMSDQETTMTKRERAQSSQEVMERYPILVAHLICASLGYFTPKAAANAIVTHIRGQDFYCEWYADMANGGKNIQDVARDTLMRAFQRRRFHKGYMAEYQTARLMVEAERQGEADFKFMSW